MKTLTRDVPGIAPVSQTLLLAGLCLLPACWSEPEPLAVPVSRVLTVACASSLAPVLEQAVADWSARQQAANAPYRDVRIQVRSGSSATLARQVEQGAPTDLFVSASEDWMDELVDAGRAVERSRCVLAGNVLVVARPREAPGAPRLPVESLRTDSWPVLVATAFDGPGQRWTTGDPEHVPLGAYARRALTIAGAWTSHAEQLVPAADARAALRLVERGEVDLGLLYATDARGSEHVEVVAEVPVRASGAVVYSAALVNGVDVVSASLLSWLTSAEGQEHFERAGFDTSVTRRWVPTDDLGASPGDGEAPADPPALPLDR